MKMERTGNLGVSWGRAEPRLRTATMFAAALLAAAAFSTSSANADPGEKRSGAVAWCSCPCALSCGAVSCQCSGTSGKCVCGQIGIESMERLTGLLQMELRFSYSDWFDMAPLRSIDVGLEAIMTGTGKREMLRLRFVPTGEASHTYRLDGAQSDWSEWLSRVDPAKPARVYFAASGDDPATYVLRDRDPFHLNESLRKRLVIESASGPIVLFSSDSTIAWEIKSYLRLTVACLGADAFLGDIESARDSLYGWIDSLDLLVKNLDLAGALTGLDEIEDRFAAAGLVRNHPDFGRLTTAVASVRSFLSSIDRKGGAGASLGRR